MTPPQAMPVRVSSATPPPPAGPPPMSPGQPQSCAGAQSTSAASAYRRSKHICPASTAWPVPCAAPCHAQCSLPSMAQSTGQASDPNRHPAQPAPACLDTFSMAALHMQHCVPLIFCVRSCAAGTATPSRVHLAVDAAPMGTHSPSVARQGANEAVLAAAAATLGGAEAADPAADLPTIPSSMDTSSGLLLEEKKKVCLPPW